MSSSAADLPQPADSTLPRTDAADSSTASAAAASTSSSAAAASTPAESASASAAAPAVAAGRGGTALETRTVALSGDQVTYLNLMRDRYKLGSVDKAARCLVNYARIDGDQRLIFGQIRCRHCGIKFPKTSLPLQLYPHQWEFLDRMRSEFKIRDDENDGKPFRCLLDFTQEGRYRRGMTDDERAAVLTALEKDMFEKVRCNDPVCTHQH